MAGMDDRPKTKRRWFRFSLRTLFVVVTVLGAGAGWVVYQLNWIRQRDAVLKREEIVFLTRLNPVPGQSWNSPPWPLAWFGAEAAGSPEFLLPDTTPDEDVARIQRLFPETRVVRQPED